MDDFQTYFDDGTVKIILVGAAVVFVSDFIGNALAFGNRVINAAVTAITFTIIFIGLNAVDVWGRSPGLGNVTEIEIIAVVPYAAASVFISDLIGNVLAFRSRVLNTLMTTIVFTAIFTLLRFQSLPYFNQWNPARFIDPLTQ